MNAKIMYETDGVANCSIPFESYGLTTSDVEYKWLDQPKFSNEVDPVVSSDTTSEVNDYPSGKFSGFTINLKVQTEMKKALMDRLLTKKN